MGPDGGYRLWAPFGKLFTLPESLDEDEVGEVVQVDE